MIDISRCTQLDAALRYAALGWRVFRLYAIAEDGQCTCGSGTCGSPGKHPRDATGFKLATTDEQAIREAFDDGRLHNLGLATGAESGVVVVDVDGPTGYDSLRELYGARWHRGPDMQPFATWCQHTGRGLHLFFASTSSELKNSAGRLGPGLDVRANGGYVVLAPSRHASGSAYRWVRGHGPGAIEMAELPDWLEARMLAKPSRLPLPAAATATEKVQLPAALSVGQVYAALGRVNGPSRDLAQRILRGASLAEPGARDSTLMSAAGVLSTVAPTASASTLLEVLQPSLAAMDTSPEGTGHWLALAQEKLSRSMATAPEPVAADSNDLTQFAMTDLGNAERLARYAGSRLRYCGQLGHWLRFDGQRWVQDSTGEAERCAGETVRELYRQASADTDRGAALRKWAVSSESRNRIASMVALAKSCSRVDVDQLDADPWVINVRNGVLDLRTGALRPPTAEDLHTKLARVDFDKDATCPRFDAFLARVIPDGELRRFVMAWLGYSLTGVVREHGLCFLHGPTGANGKSSLLETVSELMGDYACQLPVEALIHSKSDQRTFHLMPLRGARLALTSELDKGRSWAEARIKHLTGGDTLTAEGKGQPFCKWEPTHKLVVGANDTPRVRNGGNAFWRRMRVVPFDVTIPPDEQDRDLPMKLRDESSGILNRLLDGCRDWHVNGLAEPSALQTRVEQYQLREDLVGQFLSDKVEKVPGVRTSVAEMFDGYRDWLQAEHGQEKPDQTKLSLGEILEARGFQKVRLRTGRYWRDVRLTRSVAG